MKIIYAGSPQYAVQPLKSLLEAGVEVVAVLTQPDRPFGRKRVLTPTPVKQFALSNGITAYDFKPQENIGLLRNSGASLLITCAYGRILTEEVLNLFPLGVYNLHASLLPLYRGASPIQSAILNGDEYTGVTVMKTERALDSGGILFSERIKIQGRTCGELSEELSKLSAKAAVRAVKMLSAGENELVSQDGERATYCKKIEKKDAAVDFSKSSREVVNLINAMSPSPAAYAYLSGLPVNFLKAELSCGSGEYGRVIGADRDGVRVACADGAVKITRIQFAGGKPLSAADAVNGRKIKAGDRFD